MADLRIGDFVTVNGKWWLINYISLTDEMYISDETDNEMVIVFDNIEEWEIG